MRKQNTEGQLTVSRDWDVEIICATIIFETIFILTTGNPDLLDALIHLLMQ